VVQLWDTRSGKRSVEFAPHESRVREIGHAGDKYIVSASSDGEIRVWDVARPSEPLRTAHTSARITALAVSRFLKKSSDGAGAMKAEKKAERRRAEAVEIDAAEGSEGEGDDGDDDGPVTPAPEIRKRKGAGAKGKAAVDDSEGKKKKKKKNLG
jgi:hypothetical protein